MALNPDTGKLVWYYQHVANDQWDLDWVFERQIVTITIDGRPPQGDLNVGKMAILDALMPRLASISSRSIREPRTSSPHIDPKTGAKTIDPTSVPDPRIGLP